MDIIQIVPALPPKFCGVGDYSFLLAGALRLHGVNTQFIVAESELRDTAFLGDFPTKVLPSHSPADLEEALADFGSSHVFLHYVGYSYELYGSPFWLLESLENWRKESQERRLTTMFHELYAWGPPWTRAFWTSRPQKKVTAGFSELSDYCRTNMMSRSWELENWASRHKGKVEVVPVYSTVGEPESVSPLLSRQPRMAIFGSKGWRQKAYLENSREIEDICRHLGLEQIVDVGSPIEETIKLSIPVVTAGSLPPEEVSEILSDSRVGLMSYPENSFGKSTIFAAYCAHGLLPICAGGPQKNADGLEAEVHFSRPPKTVALDANGAQEIASAAHRWYRAHDLKTQAEQLSRSFKNTHVTV